MEKTRKGSPIQRTVEIPDDMWEWLRQASEERQTSRAGMIRILISAAMKREKKAGEDGSTSY